MVSDQEIASCVESLLRQAGPAAASAATAVGVVRHLEAKLGIDLSHKAPFIRDHLAFLLGPPQPPQFHPQFLHPALRPHQDLAFRYPPPPIPAAAPYQQQLYHEQPRQQQPPPVATPPSAPVSVDAGPVEPPAPPPKESPSSGVKRRGGPGGLSKVCGVSPELQVIVGEPTMARTQIVKQLWAYIRKNNLQDPNNKRKIICNDELRLVFETDCTDMFKMNKLLAKHIISLEPTKGSGPDSKKRKAAAEMVSAPKLDPDQNTVAISDALAIFLETGESEMLQSEASRRVWDYIKANKLEDPMNPMVVLCDPKLQQLLGCESISALGIQEMLARHLFKQS